MRSQFEFFGKSLIGGCIHNCDRPFLSVTIPDVNALARGIVAKVIDIVAEVERGDEVEERSVVDIELAFIAAYKELVRLGRVSHSLGFRNSADAMCAYSGGEIQNFF